MTNKFKQKPFHSKECRDGEHYDKILSLQTWIPEILKLLEIAQI